MLTFGNRIKRRKKSMANRQVKKPSWRGFQIKKRRMPEGRKFNMKTPRLIVSYFRQALTKLVYRLLILVLIAGLFYFLFFSEWLQISNIAIEGNRSTDKKAILDIAEPYLHKKRFSIFPSRSIFWVPARRIEKDVENSFRRVSSVHAERNFPNTLTITVEEKKQVLVFCSEKGCIWVDEAGESYNRSSYAEAASDETGVVIIHDNSHSDLELDKTLTTAQYVDFVNTLSKEFSQKLGRNIVRFSTPLPSAEEIRVHTDQGWVVYLDTNLGMERSLELLRRVVDGEFEKEQKDPACLEYIDLRISDKVFYKLKPECTNQEEKPNNKEEKPRGEPEEESQEKPKDKKER